MNRPNDRTDKRGQPPRPWPSAVLPAGSGQGSPANAAVFLLGVLTLVTFAAVATILATLLLPLAAGVIDLFGERGLAEAAAQAARWLLGIWFAEVD